MVIIEWHLWECKKELKDYIAEMVRIGLRCQINKIDETEWESLSKQFGAFVERGVEAYV